MQLHCTPDIRIMSRQKSESAIGFPPPLLGEAPWRMPILAQDPEQSWFALNKPANIALRDFPWDRHLPNMDAALNRQLQAGKPELLRRNADLFGSIYYLDPCISGVALFAENRVRLSELRNAFGSGDLQFYFTFIAKADPSALAEPLCAEAPLLVHNTKPKMIPSTAKGKKARTHFQPLSNDAGPYCLWQAKTAFFRPHQVRAHAATHGIPVIGDALYGAEALPAPITRAHGRKRVELTQETADAALPIHLQRVCLADGRTIEAPYPRHFLHLLRRLNLQDALSA